MFFKETIDLMEPKQEILKFAVVSRSIAEHELSSIGMTIEQAKATMSSYVIDGIRYFQTNN